MRELKYEVGDKVLIKSLDWYNENNVNGDDIIENIGIFPFFPYMARFCGQVLTIKDIHITYYTMEETDSHTCWTDEMIEGLVRRIGEGTRSFAEGQESHTKPSSELYKEHIENMNKETNKIIANAVAGDMLAEKTMLDCILAKGLLIPNGYEIKDENGNVINATKIVLEKKKTEYPKTYEECCTVLRFHYDHYLTYDDEKDINPTKEEEEFIDLMDAFSRLIVCRNAYWKIYGEEMGLGKPWEPDWTDYEHKKFVFIVEGNTLIEKEYSIQSCFLAFPTEEMRDVFYENFKELIEECKELL